jgi:hypothetical protein
MSEALFPVVQANIDFESAVNAQNSEIGLPKMSRRALCPFRYLRIPPQDREG